MYKYSLMTIRKIRDDYDLVKNFTTEQKVKILTGIRSAAESGWDFSSRHTRSSEHSNSGKYAIKIFQKN